MNFLPWLGGNDGKEPREHMEQITTTLYDAHMADILKFTGGRRLLSVRDVGRYTGLRDVRTIRRCFPHFRGKYFSASALARDLSEACGEEDCHADGVSV